MYVISNEDKYKCIIYKYNVITYKSLLYSTPQYGT